MSVFMKLLSLCQFNCIVNCSLSLSTPPPLPPPRSSLVMTVMYRSQCVHPIPPTPHPHGIGTVVVIITFTLSQCQPLWRTLTSFFIRPKPRMRVLSRHCHCYNIERDSTSEELHVWCSKQILLLLTSFSLYLYTCLQRTRVDAVISVSENYFMM